MGLMRIQTFSSVLVSLAGSPTYSNERMVEAVHIYGDIDANDYPLYRVAEASRYLRIAPATLRAWFLGTNQGRFESVVAPADFGPPPKLSFNNLAEAYVLRSLRTKHHVTLSTIRAAIQEAENDLGIERLLLRRDLKASAGDLLVEKFGEYLRLGASGQFAMKRMLNAALDRFEWEDPRFPNVLYPTIAGSTDSNKLIAINPRKSFGEPVLASKGITTSIISRRFNLKESIESLAEDYGVSEEEITTAIVYEEAA